MTGTGTAGCCARDLWLALVPNPLRDGDAFAFDRGVRRSTSITPDDRFYQNLADCIDTWLGPPQPRRDEHECPRTQSRRNDHESSEIYVRPSAATAGDDVRDDRSSPTSSPEPGMPRR